MIWFRLGVNLLHGNDRVLRAKLEKPEKIAEAKAAGREAKRARRARKRKGSDKS
jgi:hypothetical protein